MDTEITKAEFLSVIFLPSGRKTETGKRKAQPDLLLLETQI
jgi:hypothetical protein